jgi:hypothetical protein
VQHRHVVQLYGQFTLITPHTHFALANAMYAALYCRTEIVEGHWGVALECDPDLWWR